MKRKLDENNVPVASEGKKKAPAPSVTFESLGLDPRLLRAVANEGFSTPTSVQAQAIPLALKGKDVVARAYTGSGKTAAYLLPLLQSILQRNKSRSKATLALILVPTKELAQQVHKVVTAFVAFSGQTIRSLNLSQKTSDIAQRSFLEDAPEVVVGTPGAVHAGIRASTLKLNDLMHLVIDEADLVLSYGYEDDLEHISRAVPAGVQKILMSATLAPEIDTLKVLFCQDPVTFEVDAPAEEGEKMKQYYVMCGEEEKWLLLYVIFKLKLVKGKTIIFVENVDRCYRVKLYLEQFGIRSCILNPELPVNSRIHTVEEFNKNVYDIIIGSDEHEALGEGGETTAEGEGDEVGNHAANGTKQPLIKKKKKKDREFGISRGIDFQHVACVLNFDLPLTSKSYTHRIGRTARAGQSGLALSFVIPANEQGKHKASTLASTKDNDAALASIVASQSKRHRTVSPYTFDAKHTGAFAYRARDALRQVTRAAVRAARAAELRAALLHSAQLERHFAENPADRRALQRRDGELRTARVLPHLKHVPDYLLPDAQRNGEEREEEEEDGDGHAGRGMSQRGGFVGLNTATKENARRKERKAKVHKTKSSRGTRGFGSGSKARRGRADPLKTFKAGGKKGRK